MEESEISNYEIYVNLLFVRKQFVAGSLIEDSCMLK